MKYSRRADKYVNIQSKNTYSHSQLMKICSSSFPAVKLGSLFGWYNNSMDVSYTVNSKLQTKSPYGVCMMQLGTNFDSTDRKGKGTI